MSRWAELQEDLESLLDAPPVDRAARLAQLRREDPRKTAELERLIAAAEATRWDAQMAGGAAEPAISALGERLIADENLTDSRVGAWRLEALLGRGGMGAVYLAKRADGAYAQRAALKIIPGRTLSSSLGERFLGERQILATLEHPGIARLLDGGLTDDGAPYLVMEYVDGTDLLTHIQQHAAALKERIALFDALLDAVQFAHQKLIVHGDLKPDNILVNVRGELKLVDFGVARALDEEDDGAVLALTPGYSSPERLKGERLSVAADIYALGVVLYRLLTDQLPFPNLALDPPAQAQQTIEHAPATPSSLGRLPGIGTELDAICLRALAPEPTDRYGSVEQLRSDLDALRAHRPVAAMGTTKAYVLRKFARRHRLGIGAAALILVAAGSGTFAALEQAERARLEASRSEQVSAFLASLFDAANPFGTWKEEPTLNDLLDLADQRAAIELADEPAVRGQVQAMIAQAYLGTGAYQRAVAIQEAALDATRTAMGPASPDTALAHNQLAHALIEKGDYAAAKTHAERALSRLEAAGSGYAVERSDVLTNLAVAVSSLGDREQARVLHTAALKVRQLKLPVDHVSIADSKMSLATVNAALGNLEPVLKLNQEARDIYLKQYGPEHPMTLRAQNGVASGAFLAGAYTVAQEAFGALIEDAKVRLGAEHPELALLHNNQARALTELGLFEAAQQAYGKASARVSTAPEQRLLSISVRLNSAALAVELGEFDRALPDLRDAAGALTELVGEAHPLGYRTAVQVAIGEALAEREGATEALAALIADPRAEAQAEWQARARTAIAWLHLRAMRSVDAQTELAPALPILRAQWNAKHWRRAELELLAAAVAGDAEAAEEQSEPLSEALPERSVRRQRALFYRKQHEVAPGNGRSGKES